MPIISSTALALLAFGIKQYFGSSEFSDSVYSEIGVGSLGDIFKDGSEKALSRIFKNPPPDFSADRLNHHLNKAARKSILLATLYACRGVLLEYGETEGKKDEKKWLSKLVESLNAKIRNADAETPQTNLHDTDILAIFQSTNDAEIIEEKLIGKLREEAYNLVKTDAVSFALYTQDGFDLLKKNIVEGWREQANPTAPERKYDWLGLVCGIFNDECKNPQIGFAIQNNLFRNIVKYLGDHGKSFDELCEGIREIKQTAHHNKGKTEFLIDFTKDFRAEFNARFDTMEEIFRKEKTLTPEEIEAKNQAIIEDYLAMRMKDYPIGEIVGEVYPHDKFFVDRDDEKAKIPQWLFDGEKMVVIRGVSGDGKTALMTEVLRGVMNDNEISHSQVRGILTFYFRDFSGKFLDVNLLDICKKADARLAQDGIKKGFAAQYEEFRKSAPLDIPVQLIAHLCHALNALGGIWIVFDNFESALQNNRVKDAEIETFIQKAAAYDNLHFLVTSQILPVIEGINHIRQCSIADLPADYAKKFLWRKGRELKENGNDCGLAEAASEQFDRLFQKLLPSPIALISFTAYLETLCATEGKAFDDVLADDTLYLGFEEFDADDKNKGASVLIRRQFELLGATEQLILKALSIFPKPVEFPVLQAILPLTLDKQAILSILRANSLVRKDGKNLYELLPLPKKVIAKQFEQTDKNSHVAFNLKAAMFYRSIHKPVADCYTLEDFDTYFKEIEHCYQADFYENIVQIINQIMPKTTPLGMMNETLEKSRKIENKLPDQSEAKAANHQNIGVSLDSSGKVHEGIQQYDKALGIFSDLIENKGRIELKIELAIVFINKGISLQKLGKIPVAIRNYDEAIKIYKDLVENQGRIELVNFLAGTLINKCRAFYSLGKLPEAIEEVDKAIRIYSDLIKNHNRLELANYLASAFLHKGGVLHDLGKLPEAIEEVNKAIKIYSVLIKNHNRIELANELAISFINKGILLSESKKLDEAIAEYDKANEIYDDLIENQKRLDLKSEQAKTFMNKGNAFAESKKLTEAIIEYDKAIGIFKDLVEDQGRIELANDFAMSFLNKGVALKRQNNLVIAVAILKQAIVLWERDMQFGFIQNLPNLVKAYRLRVECFTNSEDWKNTAVDAVKSLIYVNIFTRDENFSEHFKRQIGTDFDGLLHQIKQLSNDAREKIFAAANALGQQQEQPQPFGDILRQYINQIGE